MARKTKAEKRKDVIRLLKELSAMEPETAHVKADQALLDYIDDPEIEKAWDNITKWYA